MSYRNALLLPIVFVAGLATAPALRAQDDAPPPKRAAEKTEPAETPDREEVRARWSKLPPEERKRIEENYQRWKKLPDERKELLRKRHARLDDARRATKELLPEDERGRLDDMRVDERRRELTKKTMKAMRDRFERLPPEMRRGIERELRDAPPRERQARARSFLQHEIEERMRAGLEARVKRGDLSREDVNDLLERTKSAAKPERARLFREFVLEHPKAFHLRPEQVKRMRSRVSTNDPMLDVRLLEQLLEREGKREKKPERDHR